MDPVRPFKIITATLREALRASGRPGFVLSGGGPEQALLGGWLEKAGLPVTAPTEAALRHAKNLLDACGHTARDPSHAGHLDPARAASELAGWALARAEDLLPAGSANKTFLLLSPIPPSQPVLPLGDLYASQIAELAGDCTLPPCLGDATPEAVRAVDEALEDYYVGVIGEQKAFESVEVRLRHSVLDALAVSRRGWHPKPLIPKLGGATLGIDLDP